MAKLADWYNRLEDTKKNIFILTLIGVCASACSLFLLLIPENWATGIPLGILLGTAIEILCYISIVKGSAAILGIGSNKKGSVAKTVLFMLGRYVLYGGGLLLGAFCQFKWNVGWLNVFAIFGAYLPVYILLIVRGLLKAKKEGK